MKMRPKILIVIFKFKRLGKDKFHLTLILSLKTKNPLMLLNMLLKNKKMKTTLDLNI